MADETKAPQIENPEKITAKDLAEMVKQMRHNQRRCQRNPTPEKLATLESLSLIHISINDTGNPERMIEFYVTGKQYDVYHVAFKGFTKG